MEKKLSELKSHPENHRIYGNALPDAKFIADIKKDGFINPIKINQDNIIIGGHRRFEAAKYLKLETIPVIIIRTMMILI